jgi:hypothetical protein
MKYNLSIGAIFKNEGLIMREWLVHYLNRGVEHFYLINDGSDDNFQEIIEEFNKYITLFNVDEDINYDGRQKYFYNKFFHPIKHETKWILVCDLDEFVWSPMNINMNHTLKIMENENISSYLINMILFGAMNFIKQPKSVVNSFTQRQTTNEWYSKWLMGYDQYKTICLAGDIERFQPHRQISSYEHKLKMFTPQYNKEKNIPIYIKEINKTMLFQYRSDFSDLNSNFFRLNHYRLQSLDRWRKIVMKRGDVNRYVPKNLLGFSPNLNKENTSPDFRNMKLFLDSNKIQNKIDDYDLINQNVLII